MSFGRGRKRGRGGGGGRGRGRGPQPQESIEEVAGRIRLPRQEDREMFGFVISNLGGARMLCLCEDNKERICRIPGRMKKHVWVKENDYVIIQTWEIEGEKKGDIVWRYKPVEVEWLKRKGYVGDLDS